MTIAYGPTGVPSWTNVYRAATNSQDDAYAIAVDSRGNAFVTGGSLIGQIGNAVTLAYSRNGANLWTNRFNETGNGAAGFRAIALDLQGNVFVTGSSGPNFQSHWATVAYSHDGIPLWTNYFGVPGGEGRAVVTDDLGNVFAAGLSGSSVRARGYVIAYTGTGNPLWTNEFSRSPWAMTKDPCGNIIVAGDTGDEYVVIKYSAMPQLLPLHFQVLSNELVLQWPNCGYLMLQSAPTITDEFTNVFGAVNPYTNSMSERQKFFRLVLH